MIIRDKMSQNEVMNLIKAIIWIEDKRQDSFMNALFKYVELMENLLLLFHGNHSKPNLVHSLEYFVEITGANGLLIKI